MRYIVPFWILCLTTITVFSQEEYQEKADSLKQLIRKETNDIKKIAYYQELCHLYVRYSNIEELKNTNEKLFRIVKKTDYKKGYGYFYKNKAKTDALNGDFRSAIIHAKKAKDIFYTLGDWDNYFYTSAKLGIYLSENEQYTEADTLLHKNILLALQKTNKHIPELYYSIARIYLDKSEYAKALKTVKKTIAYKLSPELQYHIYIFISFTYNHLSNFDKALEYNNLAYEYATTPREFRKVNNDKVEILFTMKRYKDALSLALKLKRSLKGNRSSFHRNNDDYLISQCYYGIKEYELANRYIDAVLQRFSNPRNDFKIEVYAHKALVTLALNEKNTAKEYIDQALELFHDDYFFELKLQVYEAKYKVEKAFGNYRNSLNYLEKFLAVKEENIIKSNKNNLNQLQVDFEVAEKDNKIKSLEIRDLKKELEINTKNKYLFYQSFALFFTALFALFFIYIYRTVKNKNRTIAFANLRLKNEQEKTLRSLQGKEVLLKEIHHRVKNNMQLVISLLKIQASDAENIPIEEFILTSENRIRSMAMIHEYLYESEDINRVNFKGYAEKLMNSIQGSYNDYKNIEVYISMEALYFDLQRSISLGLIINELTINAHKHAFTNRVQGSITLQLFYKKGAYHLMLSDDGIGMDKANTKGTSMGLEIVRLLVAQIEGTMDIKSDSGTQINIKFPKTKNTTP